MKLNNIVLSFGFMFISFTTMVYPQIDLSALDHYLGYKDKVTKQTIGTSEDNELISTTGFLRNVKNTTDNELSDLSFFYNNESEEPTRQIKNASKLYKENSPSVVLIVAPDASSMGAGCVITEDGYILTNYHVIENQTKMLIFFYDKNVTSLQDLDPEKFKVAEVVAAMPVKDLALLKLSSSSKFKSLRFGNNSKIDIAQDVFAIGHPETYIWSFTYGVISQLRNRYEWYYDETNICKANVIQTQTPINPGNSGGPLFNEKGELIGINTFTTGEAEGLNFAVRLDELQEFIKESKSGKHKYELIESTSSEEEEIYWDLIDSDENGIDDCAAADIDGNGKYDIIRVDEDEDGYIDYIVLDVNQDETVDTYIYDEDNDGFFEYYIMDTNNDRYYDTIGIDTNKDGTPNEFYDYER